MDAIIIQIVGYSVVFFGTFLLFNLLTRGFLLKWLRALMGRGKYLLLQVKSPIQDYWIVAPIFGDTIKIIDREAKGEKSHKFCGIPENCIFKVFGVSCGWFNEKNQEMINIKGEGVSTYDPIKVASFIERALMKPDNPEDQKRWVIQLFIYGALALGLVLVYMKLGRIEELLDAVPIGGVI